MRENIRTRAGTIQITNHMGHTSLVAHHSSQVYQLLRVVLYKDVRTWLIILGDEMLLTLGKDLTFPLWRAARLRGRNPREP